MKDPNSNPNEELARRFRADLGRPISERYYSEDELVSIFDYSGDRGDDYLRTEALLLGARLYPDSPELLQRRAPAQSATGEEAPPAPPPGEGND